MTMPTIAKIAVENCSNSFTTLDTRSPRLASAVPISTPRTRIWSTSPSTKAPTKLFGMIARRCSTKPWGRGPASVLSSAVVSMLAADAWMPAPGWIRCAIVRPMISAIVVMISNHEHRLAADASDLLEVPHAGDADRDRREDDRRR